MQDPLADLAGLLAELDPSDAPAPMSEEDRAAIEKFLEVEHSELGRTTRDPLR